MIIPSEEQTSLMAWSLQSMPASVTRTRARFQLRIKTSGRRLLESRKRRGCKTVPESDLRLFLLTLHRTQTMHPVLSPHNLIINWQCTLIAVISPGTETGACKRAETVQRKCRCITIKTSLIKFTHDTNQQFKLIVFIVPRIVNSRGGLTSREHFWASAREERLS